MCIQIATDILLQKYNNLHAQGKKTDMNQPSFTKYVTELCSFQCTLRRFGSIESNSKIISTQIEINL